MNDLNVCDSQYQTQSKSSSQCSELLTQLTPKLKSKKTEFAANQYNSWKTPFDVFHDIKQIQPNLEVIIDLCPAKDQISFDKFCGDLNMKALSSRHSMENLTSKHLKKLLKLNINKKTALFMNPPFVPTWRAYKYLLKVVKLLNDLPSDITFYFVGPKEKLKWNSSQFVSKIYPTYHPRVFQPEHRYQYLDKDLKLQPYAQFDTVLLGFQIKEIFGCIQYAEDLEWDNGKIEIIIHKILKIDITDSECNTLMDEFDRNHKNDCI